MPDKSDAGLQAVLNAAGKWDAVAIALRISPQAVSQWKQIPHRRVLSIEEAFGVPAHVQRPDLYKPLLSAASTPSPDDTSARAGAASPHPKSEIQQSLASGAAACAVADSTADLAGLTGA